MMKRQTLALAILFVFVLTFSLTATLVSTAKAGCSTPTLGCCTVKINGHVVARGHWTYDPVEEITYCNCWSDGSCCVHSCTTPPR